MGATGKDSRGEPTGPAIEFTKGLRGVDVVLADHTAVVVDKIVGGALVVEKRSKGRSYARIAIKVKNGRVASKAAAFLATRASHRFPRRVRRWKRRRRLCMPGRGLPDVLHLHDHRLGQGQLPEERGRRRKTYKDQLAEKFDAKIGTTSDVFPRGGSPAVERTGETPIGDLVADAPLDACKASDGAQIAFTNGGGIRDSLPAKDYPPKVTTLNRPGNPPPWDITVGDATSVLPFNNSAVVRKIKGSLLWDVLGFSVAKLPAADGRLLQIAGFKFTYSMTATPRIQSVTLLAGEKVILKTDATEYVAVTTASSVVATRNAPRRGPAGSTRAARARISASNARRAASRAMPPTQALAASSRRGCAAAERTTTARPAASAAADRPVSRATPAMPPTPETGPRRG